MAYATRNIALDNEAEYMVVLGVSFSEVSSRGMLFSRGEADIEEG